MTADLDVMHPRRIKRFCFLATLTASACTSPTRPGASVARAQPVSPPRDASISYYLQPVTLTMTNGVSTGGATTMVVEVATDAAFTSIVATKPVVAGSGNSSITLARLNASTTYYWRIKTTAGTESSVLSSSSSFRIGPQEAIGSPTPVQPLADSFPHKRPTFTVKNAVHTGPSTPLSYRFEVGTDAGFGNIVSTGAVPERADTTTFVPGIDLVSGSTYFWRAKASDATLGVTGDFSAAQVFTTIFPDDGSYRYQLIVRSQPWCAGHTTLPPPDVLSPYSLTFLGALTWDSSFDGMLVVSGDALAYRFSDDYGTYGGPSEFELIRGAGDVSGATRAVISLGSPYLSFVQGKLTGTADNRGRFDGSLAGFVMVVRNGIPGTQASYCASPGFSWALLRR